MIPLLILLQTALHAYTILDSKLQTQDIFTISVNDNTGKAYMQSSGCHRSATVIYRLRDPYSNHQYLQLSIFVLKYLNGKFTYKITIK